MAVQLVWKALFLHKSLLVGRGVNSHFGGKMICMEPQRLEHKAEQSAENIKLAPVLM